MKEFNQSPLFIKKAFSRNIFCFETDSEDKLSREVVKAFGEEWQKFHDFDDETIERNGRMYFDIINDSMVNKNTYGLDVGCGSGRYTKYLASRIGFMEAIDPSHAIFYADKLLGEMENVRLSQAGAGNIPFEDNTFDFVMSIGVLHHIPDTQKAMNDCVKKLKPEGYFYTYLYYNFENRSFLFKWLFRLVSLGRQVVSRMPSRLRKFVCDLIAVFVYLPLVAAGRVLKKTGFRKLAGKLPLSFYQDQDFKTIRNDALDRFGTRLEQRFSKQEVIDMMRNSGLEEIVVSKGMPYWHAVGRKVNGVHKQN